MKIIHSFFGASCLILALSAGNLYGQNVGIGFSNPLSKLTVNGNFALGADYNAAAPTNGAVIEGTVGIGTSTPSSDSKLHLYNAGTALEVIESGGTGSGFPAINMYNDSTTSRREFINMTDPAGTTGFQMITDIPGTGVNDFAIRDLAAQVNRIYVDPNGNVGIGTDTPYAPLHVGPTGTFNFPAPCAGTYFNFLNNNNTLFTVVTFPAGPQPASAIFSNDIWTNGSLVSTSGQFTASDARLKNIIGRSDSAKDLETLEKIEVTDYTMKDVVKFGTKPFKKVVAQQVEKVYPTAVTSGGVPGFTFTPDIYAASESVKLGKPGVYTISLAKAHDLQDGDTVRLITSKNPELNAIAHVVSDKAFTIETKEPLGEKVFVFGKQCTDLKAVDYDAISMLNVSATQELAKQVETLKQENLDLQSQAKRLTAIEEQERAERQTIAEQNKKIAALEAVATEMEALKKVVATMQEKENGLQKAALEQ
ncbi:MAG TPA: tail fiber domain-containing protein [Chthoniobacterales bacterium]|nr:tail fiber domain-containing protein [Chthoniobacterales bacterium]